MTVNEATGLATFTVTLNTAAGVPVTVNYGSAGGTAASGADFSAITGSLTFAPGVTSQTISVPITDDAVFEGSESFTVTLSGATNATIADGTGIGTIADDGTGTGGGNDDRPSVASVSSPTVAEGADLDFTVALSNTSTTPTTVTLAPSSGSATLGTDTGTGLLASFDGGATFVPVVGSTVSVPAGIASFIVRVSTVDDPVSEPTETLTLSASTAINAAPVTGTGTITDNEGTPLLSISGPAVIDEAAGTATYTVTLSSPSSSAVSVAYGSGDGTAAAGSDYTAVSGTLNFAAGVTSQTFTVPISNDTQFERSETFTLTLSAPSGAAIGTGSVTSQIVDDGRSLPGGGTANDDTPSIAVTAAPVVEGGQAVFTVSLSNVSTAPVVFTPSLSNGTATLGTDTAAASALEYFDGAAWQPVVGDVTIAANTSSIQLRLATTDDAISEGNETFTLTATPVSGSTPAAASAVASIVDNDGAPQFSIDDVSRNEGAGTITFTVSLSNPSAATTTVDYATASGTASVPGDVSAGTSALSGTLSFAPGVTSQTITLNIANDDVFEGSETFAVALSGASAGTSIADGSGLGTILDGGSGGGGTDDDTPRVVSVSSPTVIEGDNLDFTVALSNTSTTPTTVTLTPASGSAVLGTDTAALQVSFDGGLSFVPVSGSTVSVPAGAGSFIVRVPTVADTIDEPAETMTLAASTLANAAPVTGTGTLTDDDAAPTVASVSSASAVEATSLVHTVSLSNASSSPTTFSLALTDGTASGAGVDYTSTLTNAAFSNGVTIAAGVITVPAGVTSFTVTVPTSADTIDEANETYSLVIGAASGTGTINDDDAAPTVAIRLAGHPGRGHHPGPHGDAVQCLGLAHLAGLHAGRWHRHRRGGLRHAHVQQRRDPGRRQPDRARRCHLVHHLRALLPGHDR